MTGARRILVLNAGSSSLKFQVVEPDSGLVVATGIVERIGQQDSTARISTGTGEGRRRVDWAGRVPDYHHSLEVASSLFAEIGMPLETVGIVGVGHRVVHGGTAFRQPVVVAPQVLDAIRALIPLAPLHNPANADLIAGALDIFDGVPQVAVFDTAFFADLPAVARTYAIDRDVARQNKIQRYGFHGISHQYVSAVVTELLAQEKGMAAHAVRQIVLHLGNGASASAIAGGRAVDTSMGMTPLEGLMMGTRGGDVDPGVVLHLQRSAGMTAEEVDELLNRRSGMLGVAGAVDLRDVHRNIASGDADAKLALQLYAYRIRKYIGAYLAVLGGVDAIAFTAGVGEHDPVVRAAAVDGLEALGIAIDPRRNTARDSGVGCAVGRARVISPDGAPVTVVVVPTNEEWEIARQTAALL